MSNKVDTRNAELMAKEHWGWLQTILERVYVDAFIHGWKHAKEDNNSK